MTPRADAPLHEPRPPRVLMVDDLPANLAALEAILQPLGFETVAVQSGREALRALLREEFAVVLLDVQMPVMDGFETARHIRSVDRTKHLPIIFVTALSADQVPPLLGYREGAVDYLTKPLDPDALRSKVRVFAELYRRGETIRAHDARLARQREEAWKDDLLSVVSHELRTPLNAISSWVQLLREGGLDEAQQRRGLEIIDRNARIQARLIADVLDVSRLAQGTLTLERRLLDVGALVRGAIEEARLLGDVKGVSVTLRDDNAGATLSGDEARIRSVLDKLLANAVRHTARGGHVELSCSERDGVLDLSVVDDGEGIDPAALEQLFDRLRRAPEKPANVRGLGLGLYIARSLCELHGGSLVAESLGLGRGATFSVRLPLIGGG